MRMAATWDRERGHPWRLSFGWLRRLGRRVRRGLREHRISLVAGSLAFSAMLAIFPGLIAVVSIYGLVTSPERVTQQVEALGHVLPQSAREVVEGVLQTLVHTSSHQLSKALIVGVVLALWSASSGMVTLLQAMSIAYEERKQRGFVRQRALALGLTLVGVVLAVVALFCIAVLPALVSPLGAAASTVLLIVRWIVLGLIAWFALSVLYRVVPKEDKPTLGEVSLGSTVGTVLWIGASLLFALFVSNFGHFGTTYGPLAGVIVLMLWLYLTSLVVLLGAEVSAESRAQAK